MEIIFHKKGPLALSHCGLSAAVECTKGESRIARLEVLCVDKPFARDLFRGRIGILPPYLADDNVAAATLVRLRFRASYPTAARGTSCSSAASSCRIESRPSANCRWSSCDKGRSTPTLAVTVTPKSLISAAIATD